MAKRSKVVLEVTGNVDLKVAEKYLVEFSIDLKFDSQGSRSHAIWEAIAKLLVSCLGPDEAMELWNELQRKKAAGEPAHVVLASSRKEE